MKNSSLSFLLVMLCISCSERAPRDTPFPVSDLPALEGAPEYLASPFVTAGNRVYMVGYQDGTFPDIGWHIDGEMGGIWDHPIKLMDGFSASLSVSGSNNSFCLDKADQFINYPMANRHNFLWKEENISIGRWQFVPDSVEGMVIHFTFANSGKEDKQLHFTFTGVTDLRPTWLGERTGMIDSPDDIRFEKEDAMVIAKDQKNPWYAAFGSATKDVKYSTQPSRCIPADRKGLGAIAGLEFSLELKPGEIQEVPIYIAGSNESEAALKENLRILKTQAREFFIRKKERYQMIHKRSRITIPDKGIQQMYEWLKYSTDWLVRSVPGQGTAISAGLPDYPWWFGTDMTYTLQGLLPSGGHEVARHSINLINNISRETNGNGRIIHEVSTNGSVYNPGNVNETAQFISIINTYLSWTGDKELVSRLFPDIQKGIEWLTKEMDPDGNGYPNGSGMMEIHGLDSEMIDVAVYTCKALRDAAEIAVCIGKPEVAASYRKQADHLEQKINDEWWSTTENSFADFRGTVAEARPILDAALVRADTLEKPWAVLELKETRKHMDRYPADRPMPHVIYHNWVVNTPMETAVADAAKGRKALETATKYENAFGVFVTGIDRTEEADSVVLKSRKKTFSYTGAVMTLPTGVQAVSAARYDSPERSLEYVRKLQRSFSYALPGSMYEVSPDFGMMVQAWNIYGVAVPIVNYFFGIQPKAWEKKIDLSPRLPQSWNEASIENVRIGSNELRIYLHQRADFTEYRIKQTQSDWTISIDTKGAPTVLVNDKEIRASQGRVNVSGSAVVVILKGK